MIKKFFRFLNPIAHLGKRDYSILFPLAVTVGAASISEVIAYFALKDQEAIGIFAIFIFIALIVYFAFRSGIRGGLTATAITILYYFYIIYSRHYTGQQLVAGVETTILLGLVYAATALIIGWLKQTIDKSIEREADEKLRLQAIVDQLPVGVIITNAKGQVIQANKKVKTILGRKIPLGFSVVTETLIEATHKGKPVSPHNSPIAQTLSSGKDIVGREFTIDSKHGKPVHLQVSASAIRNKFGKVIAAASIINDITVQKEMEERKDDFVNMASHELKTPITSLKLYIDSMSQRVKKYGDSRANKTIGSIKYQTEKLQELVGDLLDLSRIQTGKLTFKKMEFRLDTLTKDTVSELRENARDNKITYDGKVPIKIYADKFRIYQVLTNLITNAIKYSPENTNIDISVKRKGNRAVVSVRDFGIGIAKREHRKIFGRLYQVVEDREKTFPGFGMGLYISKEIVRRHKGDIWVESEKGKGSTFYFSLPLHKK